MIHQAVIVHVLTGVKGTELVLSVTDHRGRRSVEETSIPPDGDQEHAIGRFCHAVSDALHHAIMTGQEAPF